MTLCAQEFIRRFLLHVLPKGFMRIRYFGFLSNRNRTKKLKLCRELLSQTPVKSTHESMDWKQRYEALTGKEVDLCPLCRKGHMVTVERLLPLRYPLVRPPPQVASNDGSPVEFQIYL